MTITPRPRRSNFRERKFGTTIGFSGRARLLLEGKLLPPRFPHGRWYGVGLDWRHDCLFRVLSPEWLIPGSVLVCDDRRDLDQFIVNVEQTALENGYPDDWRKHGPDQDGDGQLSLILL